MENDLELERLRRKVAAQEKTIRALMNRVEGRLASTGSAFSVLEQNVALEQLIARRTEELERANERLSTALGELKKSQAEATSAQRWAAIGTLAAGVAHEINTPLQYVNDSLFFLRDAFGELSGLVALSALAAETLRELPRYETLSQAMQAAIEAADINYLGDAIPPAFARCAEGLERVGTIVRSLKEFAHPGGAEMSDADLNHTIKNTAVLAKNEYKYVAELELDLQPIPQVRCDVSDLNQVVLNLLVNAAHAIGEVVQGTERKGRIRVRTEPLDDDRIRISVSDDGTGIPEAIRARIFEPFFTTKPVGKGSGQGLALVWAMVEKHGGSISLDSEVGQGTTFHVTLPVRGPHASRAA